MSEDLSAFFFSILFVLPALYLFSVSLANNMIKIIIIFLTYRMAKCVPLPINNKLDQYVHRSATSECNSILSHTHVFVHLSLCLFLTDTTDSLTFPGSIVTRIHMEICTDRSSVARFSIYLCLRNQMIIQDEKHKSSAGELQWLYWNLSIVHSISIFITETLLGSKQLL